MSTVNKIVLPQLGIVNETMAPCRWNRVRPATLERNRHRNDSRDKKRLLSLDIFVE